MLGTSSSFFYPAGEALGLVLHPFPHAAPINLISNAGTRSCSVHQDCHRSKHHVCVLSCHWRSAQVLYSLKVTFHRPGLLKSSIKGMTPLTVYQQLPVPQVSLEQSLVSSSQLQQEGKNEKSTPWAWADETGRDLLSSAAASSGGRQHQRHTSQAAGSRQHRPREQRNPACPRPLQSCCLPSPCRSISSPAAAASAGAW